MGSLAGVCRMVARTSEAKFRRLWDRLLSAHVALRQEAAKTGVDVTMDIKVKRRSAKGNRK